jgi:hypothetical protein
MPKQPSGFRARAPAANRDDVLHILGGIDDAKIIEILALRPSFADLEQEVICAAGGGDVLARSGGPVGRIVADIVDTLTADERTRKSPHRPVSILSSTSTIEVG